MSFQTGAFKSFKTDKSRQFCMRNALRVGFEWRQVALLSVCHFHSGSKRRKNKTAGLSQRSSGEANQKAGWESAMWEDTWCYRWTLNIPAFELRALFFFLLSWGSLIQLCIQELYETYQILSRFSIRRKANFNSFTSSHLGDRNSATAYKSDSCLLLELFILTLKVTFIQ